MDLTRCSNGHFYDAERFSECPYCNGGTAEKGFTETVAYSEEMEATMPMEQMTEPPKPVRETLEEKISQATLQEEDKTISYGMSAFGSEPVVGWLVCIEGKHFGEDFRITSGRNFIGRAANMDVALTGEKSISREKHAVLLYEPRANIFMIQPGDSKELSYLNDKVILQAEQIKAYDVLMLGETKLMFIPFCGENYKWDVNSKEND